MRVVALALFVILAAAAWPVHAQNPMQAGRWEVTMQMEMPNMPMQMKPLTTTQCITAEQLEGPGGALPTGGDPNACTVSDRETEGDTVSWTMACTGPEPMTGVGEMRFDGDTYEGVLKMTTSRGEMTMKYTGKRLGDCTGP